MEKNDKYPFFHCIENPYYCNKERRVCIHATNAYQLIKELIKETKLLTLSKLNFEIKFNLSY